MVRINRENFYKIIYEKNLTAKEVANKLGISLGRLYNVLSTRYQSVIRTIRLSRRFVIANIFTKEELEQIWEVHPEEKVERK